MSEILDDSSKALKLLVLNKINELVFSEKEEEKDDTKEEKGFKIERG